MTNKILSLQDAIHHEPLTELALARYDLVFENDHWCIRPKSKMALKDVDFIVALTHFYQDPSIEQLDQLSGYSFSIVLDYLKKTHVFYQTRMLPKMEMTIRSLKQTFPDHPIAIVLDHFYRNYQNELLEHIELEERMLFPYAEGLYDGFKKAEYSVDAFAHQHDHRIEDHLEDMLIVIEDEFPEVALSFAYRTFKNLLDRFRTDLSIHHMIEEQLFLNLVRTLESEISGS